MKLIKKISLLTVCFHLFSSHGQAMDLQSIIFSHDIDIAWPDKVKMTDVIGLNSASIQGSSLTYVPTVCVVDTTVNPDACKDVLHTHKGLDENSPFIQKKDNHGSHVASTVKTICPNVQIISSNFQTCDTPNVRSKTAAKIEKAANNPNIDIINLSLGANFDYNSTHMSPECPWYQAILRAVTNGKIVVKALGNEHHSANSWGEEVYMNRLEALYNRIKSDPTIPGRFIVVGNSEYPFGLQKKEQLHYSSNRSNSPKDCVITAPGTKITARVNKTQYACLTGTSMATPIVSGVIARLLGTYKAAFEQAGIHDMREIRGLIADFVLENARKKDFFNQNNLEDSFGHGVVHYDTASHAISCYLFQKNHPGVALPIQLMEAPQMKFYTKQSPENVAEGKVLLKREHRIVKHKDYKVLERKHNVKFDLSKIGHDAQSPYNGKEKDQEQPQDPIAVELEKQFELIKTLEEILDQQMQLLADPNQIPLDVALRMSIYQNQIEKAQETIQQLLGQ